MLKKLLRYIFRTLLLAALYFVSAKYSLLVPYTEGNISPIWPPSGVAFAFLVLYGWKIFPGVFLGAMLSPFSNGLDLSAATVVGIGNTMEAVAAYIIFEKLKARIDLLRLHDVVSLINASLLAPVLAATIGIMGFYTVGELTTTKVVNAWIIWYTGHALGIIVIAPLLMTWLTPRYSVVTVKRIIEVSIGFLLLIGIEIGSLLYYPDMKFLILIALVWISIRFSSRSISLASAVLTAILVVLTLQGYGPFTKYGPFLGIVFMQLFIGSTTLIALILTAVIAERRMTEMALLAAKGNLQETVLKRTERLSKVNKKLKVEIQQRKAAEAKRDEFVGVVSHELKTPITAIKTYVQLIERRLTRAGDTKNTHFLKQINHQTTKITKMISDLLDTSHIQAGKLLLEKTPTNIDALISAILTDFRHIDETHTFVKNGDTIGEVIADEGRIGQVLTNLLTNAMKYSPEGSTITIGTEKREKHITVSVRDEGQGIPKNKIDKIFDRFYRINKRDGKDSLSFGLGLYIAKEIIDEHGGKIWVESNPKKGTTFSFSLPL